MLSKDELINFLQKHYPDTDNEILCQQLGLSSSALRTLASRNGIHKSKDYLAKQHKKLLQAKEKSYLSSIPKIKFSTLEQNIIVGSILGDGSLAFSQRSRNAYYREHFSIRQIEYRKWKMNNISSLSFRLEGNTRLKSPSHPVFTDLYNKFYINGKKTVTEDNIKLLNHPIGLTCLYLDDGTLMINVSNKNNNIYITPTIGISTLCFSKKECEIIKNHLSSLFGLHFRLNPHPSGKGYSLVCSTLDSVYKFFSLIQPYCKDIISLRYKWDIEYRIQIKYNELRKIYPDNYKIRISNTSDIPERYSSEDEKKIISMKKRGYTDQEIANDLNRTYWGIVDKIRRIRKAGLLD